MSYEPHDQADADRHEYEEEVKNHPLTKEAEALEAQKDDLVKEAEEQAEEHAKEVESGKALEAAAPASENLEDKESKEEETEEKPKSVRKAKVEPKE